MKWGGHKGSRHRAWHPARVTERQFWYACAPLDAIKHQEEQDGPDRVLPPHGETVQASEDLNSCYWAPFGKKCFLTTRSLLKTLPRKTGSGDSVSSQWKASTQ